MKEIILDLVKQASKESVNEGVITEKFGDNFSVSLNNGAILRNIINISQDDVKIGDKVTLGLVEGKDNKVRILGKAKVRKSVDIQTVYLD